MSTYKRDDKEFKASLAAKRDVYTMSVPTREEIRAKREAKRFQKVDGRLTTATIDENGDVLFLASRENDIFLELGEVVTRRASHVEPASRDQRIAFHILRFLFGSQGRVSEWTRTWRCLWRVNTKPVGVPILTWKHQGSSAPWANQKIAMWWNRQDAIAAEIKFLNKFFLEGIQ